MTGNFCRKLTFCAALANLLFVLASCWISHQRMHDLKQRIDHLKQTEYIIEIPEGHSYILFKEGDPRYPPRPIDPPWRDNAKNPH